MQKDTVIHNEREKFLRYLTKAGRRVSNGRELIFDEVMRSHELLYQYFLRRNDKDGK